MQEIQNPLITSHSSQEFSRTRFTRQTEMIQHALRKVAVKPTLIWLHSSKDAELKF